MSYNDTAKAYWWTPYLISRLRETESVKTSKSKTKPENLPGCCENTTKAADTESKQLLSCLKQYRCQKQQYWCQAIFTSRQAILSWLGYRCCKIKRCQKKVRKKTRPFIDTVRATNPFINTSPKLFDLDSSFPGVLGDTFKNTSQGNLSTNMAQLIDENGIARRLC